MRRLSVIVALSLVADPAAAQSCLELPLEPAGWLVSVGARHTSASEPEYEDAPTLPAVTAIEAAIGYDVRGPASAMLSVTSSGYDVEVIVYDPETFEPDTQDIVVENTHLSARVAFDLFGSVPVCPFVEGGGFRATVDRHVQNLTNAYGGLYAGTGWTVHPHWRLDSGVEVSAFFTARMLFIIASSYSAEGDFDRGAELLPKFGFRIGGNVGWRALFAGVDAGIVYPAADPDFWLRHNSADERSAGSVGVRAGVRF